LLESEKEKFSELNKQSLGILEEKLKVASESDTRLRAELAAEKKAFDDRLAEARAQARSEVSDRDARLKDITQQLDQARAQASAQGNLASYAALTATAAGVVTVVEAEPGAAEATRRHKAPSEPRHGVEAEHSSPRPAPRGPRGIVKAADTPTPGRHSNRVTQAGEDSAGGARRPELGKPRSRPPGQSSCEPAPGPRPGLGPGLARTGPHLPVPKDRKKPGTSPSRTGGPTRKA
jgi:hypothetical protein